MDIFAKNQPFYFGEDKYTNGGHYGPHELSYLSIIIMINGKATINLDGNINTLTAGHTGIAYNDYFLDYEFSGKDGVHLTWCTTGELVCSKESIQLLKTLSTSIRTSERMFELHEMGLKMGYGKEANLVRLRNAIGEAVVYEYFHQVNLVEANELIPASITQAKYYIDRHFSDECAVNSIAKVVKMNPVYLSRLFKQYYTDTISEYVWRLRAEKGAYLICNSGMTSKEIAYQCGYKNEYHFSRHIKKCYAYSPRELRNRKKFHHYNHVEANKMDTKY